MPCQNDVLTGIIEVKLGAAVNAPTKRMYQWLLQSALDCNKARNAAMRFWLRWCEDHPERPLTSSGLPKKIEGVTVEKGQSMPNLMYHAARAAVPRLSSDLTVSAVKNVQAVLKAKVAYNSGMASRRKWQAILTNEMSCPSWTANLSTGRGLLIPLPGARITLCYCGDASQDLSKRGYGPLIQKHGESGCVLAFPLFSKDATDQREKTMIVRLEVRQLSRGGKEHSKKREAKQLTPGHRRLLRLIARREIKLSESKLVYRPKKGWFVQLCYQVAKPEQMANPEREAILYPSPAGERRPFVLEWPGGGRYFIGDGIPYAREYDRLTQRRKILRNRYKDGAGAGHGKEGFYRKLRPYSRAFRDMQKRFAAVTADWIARACIDSDCGTLVYREPTMPLRKFCWLGKHDVPFDWTEFANRLAYKLASRGITLKDPKKTKRIGIKEHADTFGRKVKAS